MARVKLVLTPQDIKSIEAMAGYGMTYEQIAHVLGMSIKTFQRRLKDTPTEYSPIDALQRGKAIAISNVSKRAYEVAKSGNNPQFMLSWLKCQAGWKEKQSIEFPDKEGNPQSITGDKYSKMTIDELRVEREKLKRIIEEGN